MTDPRSPHDQLAALLPTATRLALEHFAAQDDPRTPVVEPMAPAELRRALEPLLSGAREGSPDLVPEAMAHTLRWSVRTGHPHFLNQLYGGVDPAGVAGEWITALLNTSMYTFEVAPVATVVEQALIARLARLAGFPEGEGVFTPGGSISNLMGVLAARHRAFPAAKRSGVAGLAQPVAFLSAEAHYSTPRALSVAGFGSGAATAVPVDATGRMVPAALEAAVVRAKQEGKSPFLVVATSGTTVAGAFDPIDPIADVAGRHGLWLHVDASYGGGVLFSPKHRHLMAGIGRADSVAWNPHKMMGLPLGCSVVLTRERGVLEATNAMHADYLFHDGAEPGCDLGDLSLQCGRRPDAIKLWFSWLALGDAGYARRTERLFELAGAFTAMVREREGFALVREPEGPNVCFRYLPRESRDLTGEARRQAEHAATVEIRRALLREGRFMVNYAPLDGAATFRLVLSNPRTTPADLEALLAAIELAGEPALVPA